MLVGHVDKLTPTLVSGWAADTDAPESVVSVVIYADDQRVATVRCDQDRPDLEVRADLRGYFRHGFRCDLSPPLDFDRNGRISVRFARTGEILANSKRNAQRRPDLTPILVTASARSGTTLMMSRLLHSRKICGAALPPFEVRLLAYWSYVYRTLTAGADYTRSTHPDRPEGDGYRAGSNPYSHEDYAKVFSERGLATEYFGQFLPDASVSFIRTVVSEYYARLRDDQGKSDAIYFAEKCNNVEKTARAASRKFFPDLREIVIIRDPRDIYCSRGAFFREDSELAFVHVSNSCRELLRIWHGRMGHEIFLKYENLVADDQETFGKLSGFLDVPDLAVRDSAKEGALFQSHATSKSATDSVGRWKDLPREQIDRCNTTWGEFLGQFGYEQ